MLSSFHTHTTFCDGKDSCEAVVLSALEKGFCAIGFSGHSDPGFKTLYSMKNLSDYRNEINRLKKKYKNDIQIYLGIEEEATNYVNRSDYDYIIGSLHFFNISGENYGVDTSRELTEKCLELSGGDVCALARNYYERFCDYLIKRKPDIAGHFDLITKFDELEGGAIFSSDKEYIKLSEEYLKHALKSDVIFEINTGAISRGVRKTPYPALNLLHILKQNDAKIILNADSHSADAIDCHFAESRELLRDVGFKHRYMIYNGEFVKVDI